HKHTHKHIYKHSLQLTLTNKHTHTHTHRHTHIERHTHTHRHRHTHNIYRSFGFRDRFKNFLSHTLYSHSLIYTVHVSVSNSYCSTYTCNTHLQLTLANHTHNHNHTHIQTYTHLQFIQFICVKAIQSANNQTGYPSLHSFPFKPDAPQ